jgi:peptide/nickel transport system permease protein
MKVSAVPPGSGSTASGGTRTRLVAQVVARRLWQVPIVLLVASMLVFWLVQVVPGDPGRVALGPYASDAQISLWKQQNGLDGSTLSRYISWLSHFVTGNWGNSLSLQVPVRTIVVNRLGNSILLGAFAFVIVAAVGISLGLYQGFHRGTRRDRALTVTFVSVSSIPDFALGTLLLIVFASFAHWFPVFSGITPGMGFSDRLDAMALPAITLAAGSIGYVARMARAGVIGTLSSAFYRTAVLKGLSRRRVVRAHLARNSLVPSVAVLGSQLALLLAGNAIVETLFNYPGIGLTIVTAVRDKDLVLLETAIMLTAAVSLAVLLVADLVYMALDPRINLTEARQ